MTMKKYFLEEKFLLDVFKMKTNLEKHVLLQIRGFQT